MFRNIGAPELLILGVLIILVFGWKRLPDAARSLGRSARVFKSEVQEMREDGKKDETVRGETVDRDETDGAHRSETARASREATPEAGSEARHEAATEHDGDSSPSAVHEDRPRTDNQSGPLR